MVIVAVCAHCRHHDRESNLEINFRDGMIYHMCPKCKKESKISLKADAKPLPRIRGL